MNIHGQTFTREALLRRVGAISQLGGARAVSLAQGAARGVGAIEVDTAAGLSFTVIPDRGMDIARASFRGLNLVYHTPNGVMDASYYDAGGEEWLRTFFGGLLTTCGLTYLGNPGPDGDEQLGLHGRYSAIPASRWADLSAWVGDDYQVKLTGVMEEAALFKHKLRLTRTITAVLGENRLVIEDRIENFGYRPAPLTLLYHVNAGFPLLSESAELLVGAPDPEPFDEPSAAAMADRARFIAPAEGVENLNFLYRPRPDADGMGWAALINPALGGGLGLYLKFRAAELPFLNEWKLMAPGEYVVGIEPCNVPCENRAVLRKRGQLEFLEPGETRDFHLELGVLDSPDAIDAMRRRIAAIENRRRVPAVGVQPYSKDRARARALKLA